jgi:RNA polymerase sigma-70 factor (ECF subfamily)
MDSGPREVTQLLAKLSAGNSEASSRLINLVYSELRAMAGRCMRRERPDHTLQATALVHEAYLRLAGQGIQWQSRGHFFGIAARVMRRVLLDYAREHRAKKRGGAAARVTLDDGLLVTEDHLENVLILDESLMKLAAVDPQQSRLVELRFFAGMTVEETSEVMGISTATVKREWSHAKAWLHREMTHREMTRREMNGKATHAVA